MREIIVWGLELTELKKMGADEIEQIIQNIPKERQILLKKIKHPKARIQAIGAGLLLGYMKKQYDPGNRWKYQVSDYGKAYWDSAESPFFNLSHTGDWVFLAIDSSPVGIDAEQMKEARIAVAKRFFSEKEYRELVSIPDDEKRVSLFYKIWTMKEAVSKQGGTGLRKAIADIEPEENQHIYHVLIQENYMLTVCCLGEAAISIRPLTLELVSCIV